MRVHVVLYSSGLHESIQAHAGQLRKCQMDSEHWEFHQKFQQLYHRLYLTNFYQPIHRQPMAGIMHKLISLGWHKNNLYYQIIVGITRRNITWLANYGQLYRPYDHYDRSGVSSPVGSFPGNSQQMVSDTKPQTEWL